MTPEYETSIWESATMTESLLHIQDLQAGYGDTSILQGISLQLSAGESLALLGRNGVGKTTLMMSIMGLTTWRGGSLHLAGQDITRSKTEARAHTGIGYVPQERQIFKSLTVEENLVVAAAPGAWTLEAVYTLFPRLKERRANYGDRLSGGEQQMLAIGRALMGNPRLLLLDEPFEGLAPVIVDQLYSAIEQLKSQAAMAIVLVEQHAEVALELTAHAMVLDRGKTIWQGNSADLLGDADLLAAMIGLQQS